MKVRSFPLRSVPSPFLALVVLVSVWPHLHGAEDFHATQFEYAVNEGRSAVLLSWREPGLEPYLASVLLNGRAVATTPSVQGLNSFELNDLPPGLAVLEATGPSGPVGRATINVLESRPENLARAEDLSFDTREVDGRCEIIVTWATGDPPPAYHDVLLDGIYAGSTPGPAVESVTVLSPVLGQHCVAVVPVLVIESEAAPGRYRGEPSEACGDVPCGAGICPPPTDFSIAQTGYGSGEQDCAVLARWRVETPGQLQAIRLGVNGTDTGFAAPAAFVALFERLGPGRAYELSVRSDCGAPSGLSTRTFDQIVTLAQSPLPNPILGAPTCTFEPAAGGSLNASWQIDAPATYIEVSLVRGGGAPELVQKLDGAATSVSIPGAIATDELELQFFLGQDSSFYGSPAIRCGAGNVRRLVHGVCGGQGARPNISNAIFGLNYLFTGGAEPGCLAACFVNGDDRLDLADMVYLLAFLFTGGAPPQGWGGLDPVCQPAEASEDCASSNPACSG